MKVILLQDIRGIGKRHDVKEVSDGYARNALIPKHLVHPVTPEALRALSLLGEKEQQNLKRLEEVKRLIESRSLTFVVRTGEHREVFGSVTRDMIAQELRHVGYVTTERMVIVMKQPLKELGAHEVEADLSHGIRAKFTVILQPQP